MAIKFETNDPNKLLSSFKKAIDDGRIVTWSYDQDGDFTHAVDQWKNLAWLRPRIEYNELVFIIIKPENRNISSLVYAIYHGRFIESMLTHCDSIFVNAVATAFPAEGDVVS